MELFFNKGFVSRYSVSGMISSYFDRYSPCFIDKKLLPCFVIDSGIVPGMSGGPVMFNLKKHKHHRKIIGMVIKNIHVNYGGQSEQYDIVHSLAVSLHDIRIAS